MKQTNNKKFIQRMVERGTQRMGKITFSPEIWSLLSNGAGYDNNSASAELIDNSIGAKGNRIEIDYHDNHFKITDFGENAGMDETTLVKNFFVGAKSSTKNNEYAPGFFGLGGKTGILALIGDLSSVDVEIVTHKFGCSPILATWMVTKGRADSYTYELLCDDTIPIGTSIEFDCGKNISLSELSDFISVVYCWVIDSGVEIYLNGKYIVPCDPLYRNNIRVKNSGIFKTHTINVKGYSITINSTAFPNANFIPEEELHSFDKGNGKRKTVSTANRSGIFIRTGGRYYTLGNNFDCIMGGTAHASLDGLRIEIIIPKKLWKLIGITWNKGKEVQPFSKISLFNTGNADTGVFDYIVSLMQSFKNGKPTTEENTVKKLANITDSFSYISGDNIKFNIDNNSNNNVFIAFDDKANEVSFNPSQTNKTQKEQQGIVSTMMIVINYLVENGYQSLVPNIVEAVNRY